MSMLKAGRPSQYKEKAISAIQDNGEKTVRLNANLTKDFYKKVKQTALDLDKTVTEITIEALSEYMSENS